MANDINTTALSGRLTRDAELKYANSGTAICRFSIANNYSKKQGDQWTEEVNFFDCVMFGRRAEALQKYLVKGAMLFLQCQARHNRWQNKEGQNRSKVEFMIDKLAFGGGRGDSNGSQQSAAAAPNPEADFAAGVSPASGIDSVNDGEFQDDIPF